MGPTTVSQRRGLRTVAALNSQCPLGTNAPETFRTYRNVYPGMKAELPRQYPRKQPRVLRRSDTKRSRSPHDLHLGIDKLA